MFAAIAIGSAEIMLMVVLGSLVLVGLLAIVGGFLHSRRSRELEHAEKMKAIELGRPWPLDKSEPEPEPEAADSPEQLPLTLLKSVPLGSLGIAVGASFLLRPEPMIWVAAGAVGVTSLICGTVLSLRQGPARGPEMSPASKPVSDPDALDVVGRRG
ncbi:MAG TPA: hypothetical protein VG406_08780 [Isosphaeraceae bacterium]|jgi:hypothetical protein|nr:hypothetical protein [Isosphaeraceae bacterium]